MRNRGNIVTFNNDQGVVLLSKVFGLAFLIMMFIRTQLGPNLAWNYILELYMR